MNIYVSNLNYNTTKDNLRELFTKYGKVTSTNLIIDRDTGWSRGFGFIEMSDKMEGLRAIDELNGIEFEGKMINVTVARPRTERSGNGFNNRSGGGNRGGYDRRQY